MSRSITYTMLDVFYFLCILGIPDVKETIEEVKPIFSAAVFFIGKYDWLIPCRIFKFTCFDVYSGATILQPNWTAKSAILTQVAICPLFNSIIWFSWSRDKFLRSIELQLLDLHQKHCKISSCRRSTIWKQNTSQNYKIKQVYLGSVKE